MIKTKSALVFLIGCCGLLLADEPTEVAKKESAQRVHNGLVAFYDFHDTNLGIVIDKSGVGKPINLKVENPKATKRTGGALQIKGKTLIRSIQPATRINKAIKRSGQLTVEAWVRPANTKQSGPARIISISKNSTNRNFTLGQDGNRFDARLRASATSNNGIPSLSSKSKSLRTRLTHVVYTRGRNGKATIFLNGKRNASRDVSGSLEKWDDNYRLAIGNEIDKSRPWQGTIQLVAIYSRKLSNKEVRQNFEAGITEPVDSVIAKVKVDPRVTFFETKVAPILSSHCLECHDSATRKGEFDLSKKVAAFKGGESGLAIVPGKLDESPLWTQVESNDMPADRPALTDKEKQVLKKWIEDGAHWSIEKIDPAIYAHAGLANENFLRRLTVYEYIQTVKHTLGVDISKEAREILPRDLRADGFSNTAYNLNVDLKHVNGYATLADLIVQRMDIKKFAKRFGRRISFTDNDMGKFISNMGRWVLRGPIDEREVILYRGISTTVASAGGSYEEAVGFILEAMLQSPRFIYRIENQRGDGTPLPVSEYELASRLSYIIWGGSPDRVLLDAAENGELLDPAGVEKQIDRMLNDSRARSHSAQFVAEWLNLGRLDNMRPNLQKFPKWKPNLAADMKRETLAYFDEIVWNQKRPLADLLNAQVTFATPELAKHYGLPTESNVSASKDAAAAENQLVKYDLTKTDSRGGILTHGSVLTVGGDEASMVTRGLLVMHELLRGVVKDPPPCVDTTPVPTKAGLTQRAIAMKRIKNSNCGGCHSKFEPLAFGLEKFDGLGSFHQKDEHGNELRDDGEVLFPGDAKPIQFQSSKQLMDLLAQSERVNESITWKLTQFALGRPLVAEDVAHVESVHKTAKKNGGTYPSLIKAIVLSDLVQTIATEPEPDEDETED